MFKEIWIKSGENNLYAKLYLKDKSLPTILLLHGLGFHSFEYEKLAPLLALQGYNCLVLDFRCCGKSDGKRGYWTLKDYVKDANCALDYIRQNINDDIGVFGNSLGATVAVYAAAEDIEHKIKSVVASNCATRPVDFGLNTGFRKVFLKIYDLFSKIVPLRVSVNYFIPYKLILTDQKIIQSIVNDPLVSNARKFAVSTYKDMFSWDATKIAEKINVPILVITQKAKDKLQTNNQSMLLFNALKEPKELKQIDTGHVPDLENPDLVSGLLVDWFTKTLKTKNHPYE
jgi:alpha-beta hydrolase superfamily lysophospholipase